MLKYDQALKIDITVTFDVDICNVIFVQVMCNDLSRGLFPAKEVKLLIVDEAHKEMNKSKNWCHYKWNLSKKSKKQEYTRNNLMTLHR